MREHRDARPRGLAAAGRAGHGGGAGNVPTQEAYRDGALLAIQKRGRTCCIAKLVRLPGGERVLATPYRHRPVVEAAVSLPPPALALARRWGARRWLVRFDTGPRQGTCLALDLDLVERVGFLRPGEAGLEWYVLLDSFEPCPWADWPYVPPEAVVRLDAPPGREQAQQLALAL